MWSPSTLSTSLLSSFTSYFSSSTSQGLTPLASFPNSHNQLAHTNYSVCLLFCISSSPLASPLCSPGHICFLLGIWPDACLAYWRRHRQGVWWSSRDEAADWVVVATCILGANRKHLPSSQGHWEGWQFLVCDALIIDSQQVFMNWVT